MFLSQRLLTDLLPDLHQDFSDRFDRPGFSTPRFRRLNLRIFRGPGRNLARHFDCIMSQYCLPPLFCESRVGRPYCLYEFLNPLAFNFQSFSRAEARVDLGPYTCRIGAAFTPSPAFPWWLINKKKNLFIPSRP